MSYYAHSDTHGSVCCMYIMIPEQVLFIKIRKRNIRTCDTVETNNAFTGFAGIVRASVNTFRNKFLSHKYNTSDN